MFGITMAALCAPFLQLVGWFVAQPIASMSSFPPLLLAVAPAWYFRFGYRIPQVLFHSPKYERQAIVFTLLIMELCLNSYRTNLYTVDSLFSFVVGLSATACAFVISLAMVADLRQLTNGCLDALLIIDSIKSLCFVYRCPWDFSALMLFSLSLTRLTLALAEETWYKAIELYQAAQQSPELVAGVTSLWKLPFEVTSIENMDALGEEFNSECLYNKFNRTWSQLKTEPVRRYMLSWATLSTLRWDFALVCVARTALGVATLSQARALSYLLAVMQQTTSTFTERFSAFIIMSLVFSSYVVLRQITARLINRFVTFIRGIFLGQAQSKTLRSSAIQAQDQASNDLMDKETDEITTNIPDMLEIVAGAIESGAAISELSSQLGFVSFFALIPTLCAVILSSRLTKTIDSNQAAWTNKIEARVACSTQVFSQAVAIKMTGIISFVSKYLTNLHAEELAGMKSLRRIQTSYILIAVMTEKLPAVIVLSCAILWTKHANPLKPEVLFPSLMLLSILAERLVTISRAHLRYSSMVRSHDRIQNHLLAEDFRITTSDTRLIHVEIQHCMFNDSPVSPNPELLAAVRRRLPNHDPLQLLNATVTLPGVTKPLFLKVSVSIPRHCLTVIAGVKGSGKSMFLKLLLGELSKTAGSLYIEPGTTISYCGQAVFLQDKSIQQNIVGGSSFNQSRYCDVIQRCCLSDDIEALPDKDNTMIAAKAANLTVHQQCKMALARTAYSGASLVLVDDLLCLLDEATADEIFTALFGVDGLFSEQGRTVVLATCFQRYVADAELAVFLDGLGHVITREAEWQFPPPPLLQSIIEQLNDHNKTDTSQHTTTVDSENLGNTSAIEGVEAHQMPQEVQPDKPTPLETFKKLTPPRLFISCLFYMSLPALLNRVPDLFLSFWFPSHTKSILCLVLFIGSSIIGSLSHALAFEHYFQHFTTVYLAALYRNIVKTVLSGELNYLVSADYLSIVDRVNQHLNTVTKSYSVVFSQAMHLSLLVLAEIAVIGLTTGLTGPILLCLCALVYFLHAIHFTHCSQLQQLHRDAKLSLSSHVADAASRLEQIRASGWQEVVISHGLVLLDKSQRTFYHTLDAKQRINFVLDSISSTAIMVIALTCVFAGPTSTSTTGLSIYIFTLLSHKVRLCINFWTTFQSLQPSLLYLLNFIGKTPTEPNVSEQVEIPVDTFGGNLEVLETTAVYSYEGTRTTAISNASLIIKPGQKVAIMGASGSGKTSFIYAILNLLGYTGSIKLGSLEVATAPHLHLRSRISTSPSGWLQLPGTVVQNLMPWKLASGHENNLSMETAKQVLVDVDLWSYMEKVGGLSSQMIDLELSEDQRTRFKLARLILLHLQRQNQVVIMDDLMATLDKATQEKLSPVVSKYFSTSTVMAFCETHQSTGAFDVVYSLRDGQISGPEATQSQASDD